MEVFCPRREGDRGRPPLSFPYLLALERVDTSGFLLRSYSELGMLKMLLFWGNISGRNPPHFHDFTNTVTPRKR